MPQTTVEVTAKRYRALHRICTFDNDGPCPPLWTVLRLFQVHDELTESFSF